MNTISFTVISTQEYSAQDLGCDQDQALTALGGCSDYGSEMGLGAWQFEITVAMTKGEEDRQFLIIFQPEERNNGIKNYAGWEVSTASMYGCDADESLELERFCDDYDAAEEILGKLQEIATEAAKAAYIDLTHSLFSEDEVKENPLYASLMRDINALYIKHGRPVELEDRRTTTTGDSLEDEWTESDIGDWGGVLEGRVASWAQSMLDEVTGRLSLGIHYYYANPAWSCFTAEAAELLATFNAWDRLCGLDPMSDMGIRDDLVSMFVPKYEHLFTCGQYDDALVEIQRAMYALGDSSIVELYINHVILAASGGVAPSTAHDFFEALSDTINTALRDM